MSKEIWRPVIGYEGLYEVSNYGRVKSLNYRGTGKEGLMNGKIDKNGYKMVILHKNGKRKSFLVHRLVAIAFIPNPNNLPEVNHIIDDFEHRSDNRVENLEWCTREYNLNYGSYNEKMSKTKSKKVICITNGEIFGSAKKASEKYNINHSDICKCCRGKLKSAGKHPITKEKLVWEYID